MNFANLPISLAAFPFLVGCRSPFAVRRSSTSTWTEVQEFDQGTPVIDVSEGDSDGPVWRGSARAELHRHNPTYEEQLLPGAARAILDELPTTPSSSGE